VFCIDLTLCVCVRYKVGQNHTCIGIYGVHTIRACVRECARACVSVHVRACVCTCMHACFRACVHCVCAHCVSLCLRALCLSVQGPCACTPSFSPFLHVHTTRVQTTFRAGTLCVHCVCAHCVSLCLTVSACTVFLCRDTLRELCPFLHVLSMHVQTTFRAGTLCVLFFLSYMFPPRVYN